MSNDIKNKLSTIESRRLEETVHNENSPKIDLDNIIDEENDDFEDCNFDDDQNNNYICESEEETVDENDYYLNDPEYFDYECYPIEKIDWIIQKKLEKLFDNIKIDEPLDALYILKQFKWNCESTIDLYKKDKQSFLISYFNDNNNNSKNTNIRDKTRLFSYLNIYEKTNISNNKFNVSINNIDSLSKNSLNINKNNKTYDSFDCNICFNTKSNLDLLCIDECSHYFCSDCWKMHFESLINNGATHLYECMQTKCKVIANKEFVLKCLAKKQSESCSKNLSERYKRLIALDFIKECEDLQLCPGEETILKSSNNLTNSISSPKIHATTPYKLISTVTSTPTVSFTFKSASPVSNNQSILQQTITKKCHNIVWAKSKPASRRVICKTCNTQFCFLCSFSYHAPNSCETIRKWNLKCQDDSETRNYLLVHTQDCPKCKVCIEKNGGCSHMTCNRCKHEFCWVCGNDWRTHGASYDCNRYKGNPEQDNAREALNRYTHYYHRWINHANSLKFEKALREQCQVKIQEKIMNKGGGTLVDWEFLIEAVDVLTKARYSLQYTYPYAYYLEDNESKMLFENIQAELEREVENLSHSLEKVNLNDKFNIKTQMNIVEKRRKTLLKDFIQ